MRITIQDVNCIYENMPVSIKGYTIQNSDCSFTIVLNARHTREQNLLSYAHELAHISNGDFEQLHDVSELEFFAHKNMK